MKVKELIEVLQKHCDPEKEVWIAHDLQVSPVAVVTKDDSGVILDVNDWLDLEAWWIDVLWTRRSIKPKKSNCLESAKSLCKRLISK